MVKNGHKRNPRKIPISTRKSPTKRRRLAKITHALINIPMPIENPINPSLYSFFQGLKNVLRRSGIEKS